jgi:hypothetical protein
MARARTPNCLGRNYLACGKLSLLAPYFRLFRWLLSAPYRLAPRAAAPAGSPLFSSTGDN